MAEGRERGCGMAVAVVLVVAVIAGAAGYVMWTRYTRSPQYATLKALQAVSWRDYDEFRRWVDVDAVVDDAIAAGTPAGAEPPAAVRDAIEGSVKAGIRQRITQGVGGVPRNVPFAALMFGDVIRGSSITGEDAYVTAETTSGTRDLRFDLRLRRQGERWRIVELRNASELLLNGL